MSQNILALFSKRKTIRLERLNQPQHSTAGYILIVFHVRSLLVIIAKCGYLQVDR